MDQADLSYPPIAPKEKFPIGMHLVLLVVLISFIGELGKTISGEPILTRLWTWSTILLAPFIFYGLWKRKSWGRWLVVTWTVIGILTNFVMFIQMMLNLLPSNTATLIALLISVLIFVLILFYISKKKEFFS